MKTNNNTTRRFSEIAVAIVALSIATTNLNAQDSCNTICLASLFGNSHTNSFYTNSGTSFDSNTGLNNQESDLKEKYLIDDSEIKNINNEELLNKTNAFSFEMTIEDWMIGSVEKNSLNNGDQFVKIAAPQVKNNLKNMMISTYRDTNNLKYEDRQIEEWVSSRMNLGGSN